MQMLDVGVALVVRRVVSLLRGKDTRSIGAVERRHADGASLERTLACYSTRVKKSSKSSYRHRSYQQAHAGGTFSKWLKKLGLFGLVNRNKLLNMNINIIVIREILEEYCDD